MIVNADKIENQFLLNASITKLDETLQQHKILSLIKLILKKNWILFNPIITNSDNSS